MIKANVKQMGLHGERRNVTGMVQTLCTTKKDKHVLVSSFRRILSAFVVPLQQKQSHQASFTFD